MRLFTKTLLSFAGIILFQSVLTVFFVASSIQATNRTDARRELEAQARVSYESFNAWKRRIWKSLIDLVSDEELASLAARGYQSERVSAVAAYLRATFVRTGYDVIYFTMLPGGYSDFVPISYNTFSLGDVQSLHVRRNHPYVEIAKIGPGAMITGVARLPVQSGGEVRVFIIKRIDRPFCDSLSLNRSAFCLFYLNDREVAGGTSLSTVASAPLSLPPDTSYGETYEWPSASGRYNVAIQRVPNLAPELGNASLELATFVSNLPYEQRLHSFGSIVLLVSAASAALMLLLSFGLTGTITVPVRCLLGAIRHFQDGEYVPAVARRSSTEISQLLDGFNEMAGKLHQDRLEMDRFVHEITFLHEYNEKVIESIRAGILVIGEGGFVQKTNSAFRTMFDLSEAEVTDRALSALSGEVFDRRILEGVDSILSGNTGFLQTVRRTRSGRAFEVKLYPLHPTERTTPLGCILVVDDVSRKIELDEKIYQAEKLSSLSMLSAGVAHEINNPLSSIMTNVQNLLTEDHGPETRDSLRWIERETRRIAAIVQELLRFSSPDGDPEAGCDVNAAVAEALALFGYSLGSATTVAIRQDLADNLPPANIGTNELKQVVINLVKNSVQAISGHGAVTVSTAKRRDGKIEISVADTGTGMTPEVVSHVFDPFFTTKGNGEGTGLGLSVVYGILKKWRATIRVASQVGNGTRITMALRSAVGVRKGRTVHGA